MKIVLLPRRGGGALMIGRSAVWALSSSERRITNSSPPWRLTVSEGRRPNRCYRPTTATTGGRQVIRRVFGALMSESVVPSGGTI